MYRGRLDEAHDRLEQSLDLARQSDVGFHLLDRIYGARIALADRQGHGRAAEKVGRGSAVPGRPGQRPAGSRSRSAPTALADQNGTVEPSLHSRPDTAKPLVLSLACTRELKSRTSSLSLRRLGS